MRILLLYLFLRQSSNIAGNTKFAQNLQTYLFSRDHYKLKSEFQLGNSVDCIENQPAVDVVLGKHVYMTVGDYYFSEKAE